MKPACKFFRLPTIAFILARAALAQNAPASASKADSTPDCAGANAARCIDRAEQLSKTLPEPGVDGGIFDKIRLVYSAVCNHPDPAWCAFSAVSAVNSSDEAVHAFGISLLKQACLRGNYPSCIAYDSASGSRAGSIYLETAPFIPPRCHSGQPLRIELTRFALPAGVKWKASPQVRSRPIERKLPPVSQWNPATPTPDIIFGYDFAGVAAVSASNPSIHGRVVMVLLIDENGNLKVPFISCSDLPILTAAALTSIRQWTFKPAQDDSLPVASVMGVEMRFTYRAMDWSHGGDLAGGTDFGPEVTASVVKDKTLKSLVIYPEAAEKIRADPPASSP